MFAKKIALIIALTLLLSVLPPALAESEMVLPSVVDGHPVTAIDDGAFFALSNVEKLVIPEGVTHIGALAFAYANDLKEVVLPASLASMAANPFTGCVSLETITLAEGNGAYEVIDGALVEKSTATLVIGTDAIPASVRAIGECAFAYRKECTALFVPAGVTEIGAGAFAHCESLTEITLPESVASIGDWAFMNCDALTHADLPEGLEALGQGAFAYCNALARVSLPDSLKSIGADAFFTSAEAENKPVAEMLVTAIEDSYALAYLEQNGLPAQVKAREHRSGPFVYILADGKATLVRYEGNVNDEIILPAKLDGYPIAGIDRDAFKGMGDVLLQAEYTPELHALLQSLSLRYTFTSDVTLTEGGFEYAFNPDGTINIVRSLTEDKNVSVPAQILGRDVTSLGKNAFSAHKLLLYVTLPDTLQTIDPDAFKDVDTTYTVLTVGLESEGERFARERDLLYTYDQKHIFTQGDFEYSFNSDGTLSIERYIGKNEGDVVIPELIDGKMVTEIAPNAFAGLDKVTAVTLPKTIYVIGENAFKGCTALRRLHLPELVERVDAGAFDDCPSLKLQVLRNSYQAFLLGELGHDYDYLNVFEVGNLVGFGAYEQDNNLENGKEEIEWFVLERDGDRALLLSRFALDCKPYHRSYVDVTWNVSYLRAWLNDVFYAEAFDEEDQLAILSEEIDNPRNNLSRAKGCRPTRDAVFLLSIDEAKAFEYVPGILACKPTAYALAQGAFTNPRNSNNCWWWLRSAGANNTSAASVISLGIVREVGYSVYNGEGSVRPAIWVDLSVLE